MVTSWKGVLGKTSAGSNPANGGKWQGDREAEGACLENKIGVKANVGSTPTLVVNSLW